MDIVEALIPIISILTLFIGLPWLILHYRWKHRTEAQRREQESAGLSTDLVRIAERLERRLAAIETILDSEAPGWRTRRDTEGA